MFRAVRTQENKRGRFDRFFATGVALVLGFWRLGLNGLGNTYYTAADITASHSFRSLYFSAFDQAGVMSIDKPPLGIAAPALAVRLFGVSSWTILGPQVLMFAAGVFLMHGVLCRWFDRCVANVAVAVLVVTPIDVVVARSNNPDALLVFLTIVGLVFVIESLERYRLWWVTAAGVTLGLAFTTKFLQAVVGVPAVVVCLAVLSPGRWRRRFARVSLFGVASTVSSLAWIMTVDCVGPTHRPYVANSSTNSARDLAFGFNGTHRIVQLVTRAKPAKPGHASGLVSAARLVSRAASRRSLLDAPYLTQCSWLLLAALIGGVLSLGAQHAEKRRITGFLLSWCVVHSAALMVIPGKFSPYYVAPLVPGIAALFGISVGTFAPVLRPTARAQRGARDNAKFIAVLAVGFATTWSATYRSMPWITFVAALCSVVAVSSAWIEFHPRHERAGLEGPRICDASRRVPTRLLTWPRRRVVAVVAAVAALSVGPARWTVAAVSHGADPVIPSATIRPQRSTAEQRAVTANDGRVLAFAQSEAPQHSFALATSRVLVAARGVVADRQAIATLGGFFGTDPYPTLGVFTGWISTGKLRWVAIPDLPPGWSTGSLPPGIVARPWGPYARANCTQVQPRVYGGVDLSAYWRRYDHRPLYTPLVLFDCAHPRAGPSTEFGGHASVGPSRAPPPTETPRRHDVRTKDIPCGARRSLHSANGGVRRLFVVENAPRSGSGRGLVEQVTAIARGIWSVFC